VGSNLADKVHRFPFVEAVRLPATAPGRWFGASEAANTKQRHETENEKGEEEKEEDEVDRAYEPFVSADGSVGYMFESAGIPARIRADTRGRAKVRNGKRKALSSLGLARSLLRVSLALKRAFFDSVATSSLKKTARRGARVRCSDLAAGGVCCAGTPRAHLVRHKIIWRRKLRALGNLCDFRFKKLFKKLCLFKGSFRRSLRHTHPAISLSPPDRAGSRSLHCHPFRSDYRYLAHNYVPHRLSFNKVALPAAVALARDDCLGPRVLNGTLADALAAEDAAAAGGSVASPPDAVHGSTLRRPGRRAFPTAAFYHSSCGRVAADPHQLVGPFAFWAYIHTFECINLSFNVNTCPHWYVSFR